MKIDKNGIRTYLGLFVLLLIVIMNMTLFENPPSVHEQKVVFEQSVRQLNFYELKEQRREFINKRTYSVYYSFSDFFKDNTQEDIENFIVNKFRKSGWNKKSVIDEYDDSKIINFTKKDKKYYCVVEIYKKGVALRFRY